MTRSEVTASEAAEIPVECKSWCPDTEAVQFGVAYRTRAVTEVMVQERMKTSNEKNQHLDGQWRVCCRNSLE